MLLADAGHAQAQICEALGCAHVTARYWITMAQMGQAHHWNERPLGRPKRVNEQFLDRLRELVTHSPREYGYGFRRWTAQWLAKHLEKELGVKVSDRYINYLLKDMGLSTRQPQPTEQPPVIRSAQGIAITDLPSEALPDELWQFNLPKTS